MTAHEGQHSSEEGIYRIGRGGWMLEEDLHGSQVGRGRQVIKKYGIMSRRPSSKRVTELKSDQESS